jgi:hypothetical protein
MLIYVMSLLRQAGKSAVCVRYLSTAEGERKWHDGQLWSVDSQGIVFLRRDGDQQIADCLPWASVAAIQVALETTTIVTEREHRRVGPR